MKTIRLLTLALALLALTGTSIYAADANPSSKTNLVAASPIATETKNIVMEIQKAVKEGKRTEADLASHFQKLDDLLAKHKNEKTDDVARIPYTKAMLYMQILDNPDKAITLLEQVKRDFPETKTAKGADTMVANIEKQKKAKEIQKSLAVGTKFPDFDEKDLAGKSLSIANYKGKVVLVDFWATWCGPCVQELPNVLKTYQKHNKDGFEIIGVSLDRDEKKLKDFIEKENMTWAQFYDGQYWNNKLAQKYGINSIPMTYLLDGEGKIIGKSLRGEDLETAVVNALAKK